ncbi:purine nucleoside permease [Phyllobacterium salinisoli]|uniref:Purine nucleoside permease n=2 Tax=Phyllobacterium salinisoli TaxID=1899321 RepID=A0A368K2B3_9HYPH|nr:purine nucleoside permease [Phyllobacterium salinisoli]
MSRFRLSAIIVPTLLAASAPGAPGAMAAETVKPKVMVITMFGSETKPWLENEKTATRIAVPGFPKEYPDVACSAEGLCVLTTAMGYANAASTLSALIYSPLFDLKQTYFIIAGIAGVDPSKGTLGSAHWARFAIDGSLRHEIDPRQVPAGWTDGVLALGAKAPGEKAQWGSGTEVYRLNEKLLQKAFALSRETELTDSEEAHAYRAHYAQEAAKAKPVVSICDTLSSDSYWHGSMIAESMANWATLMTQGEGSYCTTQMEDNATLTALRRGADAGLLDFDRIGLLRTASNFDREGGDQTPVESLTAKSGGFGPSTVNAYRVASTVAKAIIGDWNTWANGVPGN